MQNEWPQIEIEMIGQNMIIRYSLRQFAFNCIDGFQLGIHFAPKETGQRERNALESIKYIAHRSLARRSCFCRCHVNTLQKKGATTTTTTEKEPKRILN